VYINNNLESPVVTTIRFRYTISRLNIFLFINYYPTPSKEIILIEDNKYIYRRLPSLRKEENNILVFFI